VGLAGAAALLLAAQEQLPAIWCRTQLRTKEEGSSHQSSQGPGLGAYPGTRCKACRLGPGGLPRNALQGVPPGSLACLPLHPGCLPACLRACSKKYQQAAPKQGYRQLLDNVSALAAMLKGGQVTCQVG
jgi:hypothetical protein